jgi:hypothetical protein
MISPFSIYGGANGFPSSNGKSSYKPSAANENRITIEIHSPFYKEDGPHIFATITGFLSKELQYDSKGNYKDIFNVSDLNSILVNFASDELQRNLANYGYLTKKTYANSESPSLSFEFRCLANDSWSTVNDQRIVNPIKVANYLIGMTLPQVNVDAALLQEKTLVGGTYTLPLKESYAAGNSVSMFNTAALQLDSLSSRKPPVCRLKIGNIFEKDMMVLKNVSVTVSKEYHAEGVPLYADFNVSFESLFSGASISDGISYDDADLNRREQVFGSGFNSKNGADTRIQYEGAGYDNQDTTKLKDSLKPPPKEE